LKVFIKWQSITSQETWNLSNNAGRVDKFRHGWYLWYVGYLYKY
jgi:hypothetical protein